MTEKIKFNLRNLAINIAINTIIAVSFVIIREKSVFFSQNGFLRSLIFSQSIGLTCYLLAKTLITGKDSRKRKIITATALIPGGTIIGSLIAFTVNGFIFGDVYGYSLVNSILPVNIFFGFIFGFVIIFIYILLYRIESEKRKN
ncbi:MAG: hypothetical protein CSB55_03145 [Candidatus Cloacimonadota bacterium]|nr:MAG: hypothetical protein CSB55_03145 [Candidatus Cloacimonadota bacterium]